MTSRAQRRKRPQPGRRAPRVVEVDRRDAALLARAGELGVPAAVSRRRARRGYTALGLATLTGITVPALLERSHLIRSGAPVAGAATAFVAWLLLDMLSWAGRTVTHGPDGRRITARTITGLRTVDLDQLASVRRVRDPGRSGWIDHLWITDRSGVSLWVDTPAAVAQIAAAVRRTESAARPGVRVSRFAAERLDPDAAPIRRRGLRAIADFTGGIVSPVLACALGALATWLIAAV